MELEEHIQEFVPNAVTPKLLKDLYKHIEKDFILGNIELSEDGQGYQEVYGLYFQIFADEKSRDRMDEDNYLGLSHDYFSEDIKFVLQSIEGSSISTHNHISDDLVRYITVLGENNQEDKIDLVSPKERNKYFQNVSDILEVENAPLGKWPSKFMPAFMQQIAVNLCIRKGTSELYGKNSSIFSVNGPPGTGKTTLLKEIVVSNIIERAILLAKYEDPDDAFKKQSFLHGEKQENAYSTFTRSWYRLKDDTINDYSILVTSCNNAAVENVSKELPLGTSILEDLKPAADDTEEYTALLDEVSKLFDPAQAQTDELISKKSCKDIYFTEYAKSLFDNEGVWGLVAAPLGKRANISAFYNQVLSPLYWDFYPNKEFKDLRIKKYIQAKDEFNNQIKVVQGLQAQLKDISVLVRERADLLISGVELEKELSKRRAEYKSLVEVEESHINRLKEIVPQKFSQVKSSKEERERIENLISAIEQEAEVQFAKKRELLEKETAVRRDTSILDMLFQKKKVAANEQLADYYHEGVIKAGVEIQHLAKRLDELKEALNRAQMEVDDAIRSKEQINTKMTDKKFEINKMESQIQELEDTLERYKTKFASMESVYLERVEKFTQEKSVDAGLILDINFTKNMLSQNIKESTDAQVANPWFTKRYNIEREKLFYYAMKLHKEFVLSSKSCRDNFKTLGHYWGMLEGDDKERIAFHKEDKERFAGALYQSLFLLVPVLSTTFASLGKFLCDAKQTGVIGTLIVDEAGQAQPQMAVVHCIEVEKP